MLSILLKEHEKNRKQNKKKKKKKDEVRKLEMCRVGNDSALQYTQMKTFGCISVATLELRSTILNTLFLLFFCCT